MSPSGRAWRSGFAAAPPSRRNRAIQRDFARDPVSWAARTYLSAETTSL